MPVNPNSSSPATNRRATAESGYSLERFSFGGNHVNSEVWMNQPCTSIKQKEKKLLWIEKESKLQPR